MIPVFAVESGNALFAAVLAGLGAIAGGLFAVVARSIRRRAQVPHALRPGPSDEELERRVLDRYLVVGTALTVFMAIFLPAVLALEPSRIERKAASFAEASIERGAFLYGDAPNAVNCARCHGAEGEGGLQQHVSFGQSFTVAEPPLRFIVARYKAAGRNEEDIKQLVRDAIERGRPGTPMPTWGLAFGGPLHAQQLDDMVNFILAPEEEGGLQVETPETPKGATGADLFSQNCAVCHGANGEGGVGPNLTIEFQRNSRAAVFDIISTGRLNTNRPSMPSWAYLGKDAIEALVNFIQSIQRSA